MPGYHGKGKKMARKSYGGGSSHMDRGLSYANAPQGYRDDSGKPMGKYGHPPNGYINQSGMPNAGAMRRMMDYMSTYYGSPGGAGNVAGGVNYSTNSGTSPSPGSMDPTYTVGQATIGKAGGGGRRGKKRMKYS